MKQFFTTMPTMKEIEQWIFRKLQEEFAKAMKRVLETLDQQILEQRDRTRFRAKEQKETGVNTVFGTVRFKRWLFQDRQTGEYVYLLDRMLQLDGLYTKLQRSKRRGMENEIAVVHEGWEKNGKRMQLKNKQYYLHTGKGDFWEGFGDFLAERTRWTRTRGWW